MKCKSQNGTLHCVQITMLDYHCAVRPFGKYQFSSAVLGQQCPEVTKQPLCCALCGTRWRYHSTTVEVTCTYVFSCNDTALILSAASLQTSTLATSPSKGKAKRVTLTDGMSMPLTGTCVFVLKVLPSNRAVNLSSMEDVSTCVSDACTVGVGVYCFL